MTSSFKPSEVVATNGGTSRGDGKKFTIASKRVEHLYFSEKNHIKEG